MRNGTCKWMGSPDVQDLIDGTALLEITSFTKNGPVTALYWVYAKNNRIRLKKDSVVYEIKDGKCNCPDAKNGFICKHVKATKNALAKIK